MYGSSDDLMLLDEDEGAFRNIIKDIPDAILLSDRVTRVTAMETMV